MSKDLSSKPKVAYITGGTKGIGLAIVERLLIEGYHVAFSGRSNSSIQKAKDYLEKEGLDSFGIVSDVRKYEDERAAISEILSELGKLDIVIANAGVGHFAPIDQLTTEQWNEVIDINLTGAFHTLKSSFESLKTSKGYYISIASLAGTNFFANGSAYNASKFGLVGFTQAAMLDLRQHDIKVSTIMPGSVSTYFNNNTPGPKDDWKIQPEDIAQIVVDLLNMNSRTLPSKVEVRPSWPHKK